MKDNDLKIRKLLWKALSRKARRCFWWLLALLLVPVEAIVVFLAEQTGPLWREIQRRYDQTGGYAR